MKKLAILISTICCLFLCTVSLAGCGLFDMFGFEEEEYGGSIYAERQYNRYITYKLSFTSEEECPYGNISDEFLHDYIDFKTQSAYYLVVDFTVSAFQMEGWSNRFSASVKISTTAAVSAKLEEAATSTFSERVEDGAKYITTTYTIPEDRTQPATYRLVIALTMNGSTFTVGTAFYGDNQSGYGYIERTINRSSSAGVQYKLNSDGQSYTVTGADASFISSSLTIGELYEGLPVTAIATGAFKNHRNLESVSISDNVTSIGLGAFYGCSSLRTLEIPFVGATKDGNGSTWFSYIFDESRVTSKDCVPESLSRVTVTGGTRIDNTAFNLCKNLYYLTLPYGITEIGSQAFGFCEQLSEIVIPESVTVIGESAFRGCRSLKSMHIPDSVTSIDGSYNLFSGCTSLNHITVGEGNPSYYSTGNCLVETASQTVVSGCGSCTMPEGITAIGEYAFYEGTMSMITIPESVTTIGRGAFLSCTELYIASFVNMNGWVAGSTQISSDDLSDPRLAARYLATDYYQQTWTRS